MPGRVVIIGAGVAGAELSQAYSTLGSKVTLIEGKHRPLPREEEFACEQLTASLTTQGVDIRTGQMIISARRERGIVTVTLDDGSTADGDEIIIAAG